MVLADSGFARVDKIKGKKSRFPCPPYEAAGKRSLKKFREESDDIEVHGGVAACGVCVRGCFFRVWRLLSGACTPFVRRPKAPVRSSKIRHLHIQIKKAGRRSNAGKTLFRFNAEHEFFHRGKEDFPSVRSDDCPKNLPRRHTDGINEADFPFSSFVFLIHDNHAQARQISEKDLIPTKGGETIPGHQHRMRPQQIGLIACVYACKGKQKRSVVDASSGDGESARRPSAPMPQKNLSHDHFRSVGFRNEHHFSANAVRFAYIADSDELSPVFSSSRYGDAFMFSGGEGHGFAWEGS